MLHCHLRFVVTYKTLNYDLNNFSLLKIHKPKEDYFLKKRTIDENDLLAFSLLKCLLLFFNYKNESLENDLLYNGSKDVPDVQYHFVSPFFHLFLFLIMKLPYD